VARTIRFVSSPLRGTYVDVVQTARLWDPLTGEMKMEFRGHDHIIEIAVFAPAVAYPAIRELAGLPVRGSLRMTLGNPLIFRR
jgi:hypothetical protein